MPTLDSSEVDSHQPDLALDPKPKAPTPNQWRASSEASTNTPSRCTASSSSDRSHSEDRCSDKDREIAWDELRLGHRIQPASKYAHCADDIRLLAAFLDLAKVPDVDGNSVKLLLRMLTLLHRCSYSAVDICSVLAHASAYFSDVYAVCGGFMDAAEVGNVLVVTSFLAHSYIQDETCPLRVWHQCLFRSYCPLKKLSEALMRCMAIRKYVLRLDADDLSIRCSALCTAIRMPLVEQVC